MKLEMYRVVCALTDLRQVRAELEQEINGLDGGLQMSAKLHLAERILDEIIQFASVRIVAAE